MDWSGNKQVRDAARDGDYGRVIKQARKALGLTQGQLGEACGLSQSAMSRLEDRGVGPYNMSLLASAASHLGIPPNLVGLADYDRNGNSTVERREFLNGVAAVVATPALPPQLQSRPEWDSGQAAALRVATTAFRRLDATVGSRDLAETAQAHLRLIQRVASQAPDASHKARMAAVGSEAASLVGWLAWDMADHGSARTWYGSAIKAARTAGDPLLGAYQTGSLAQFEVEAGNTAEGLRLVARARRQLGPDLPAIAAAWLASIEAVAHATAGDERATERALRSCEQHTARVPREDPPPWPWVFSFDERKVASCRVVCGARLGRSQWGLSSQEIATALSSGHEKQRALLTLDVATGHLSTGRVDSAFALATRAVQDGVRLRSGRIVERARAFRRSYATATPPGIVRDFDTLLHDTYL
ncbi:MULTISPECIES: helix-turn-helix transcriptional regulator [unclassified Streptomyces]|uniref:helix-turn-helix domain-containing protein n=1 Tax=unclassified Streptomyces TaxID=2593676 RepID=UPI0029AC0879|nr:MULTISPECIES: helix-turn-helix transcriptional regulator [unclassified Streptomyces]MDX3766387.1 helix-turn-helix transcriptional regulator [Streptomyces sp. AK08-01B]MDX3816357.1 helix-turn-helix transcriptional regulator [Streptomyces sp. AK08-01A]